MQGRHPLSQVCCEMLLLTFNWKKKKKSILTRTNKAPDSVLSLLTYKLSPAVSWNELHVPHCVTAVMRCVFSIQSYIIFPPLLPLS
jgi:hypothetical protein